jgi:fido (protein-threonine AMPylation protein)|nr:Fic family protein [uncultured Trichococcus sp.]
MDYPESKLPPSYDVAENELPYQIKLALWQTAFGLQKVDGLSPSEYMVELAYEHIEGKKGYDAIYREISDYHRETQVDASTVEADIVSLRIAELLAEDHFLLSPSTLLGIHRHLFADVFPEEIPVGKFRTVNITKKEPVLDGETVQYSSHFMIQDTLAYDFEKEQNFSYSVLTNEQKALHAMAFLADIWQVHPFREGNTRTVAVFGIQYLRKLGFHIDNSLFSEHADYFRNALVLYHYHGEKQDKQFLKMFFENLLLGKKNILSDEEMYTKE